MWAVRVRGLPAPKGSMKCVGRNGRHQLVPDNAVTAKVWHGHIVTAGRALLESPGGPRGTLRDGPVSVEITFTVPKPASIMPAGRPWPVTRSAGDVDKLARLVLDGLTDSGIWRDDSQVVELTVRKAYPHTPAPDLTPEGGALIRIWRTEA